METTDKQPKVLVSIPVKPNTQWVKNAHKIFDALSYKNKVDGIWDGELDGKVYNKYSKNCQARNGALSKLTKDIDYVLWVDADVVVSQDDLIERLLEIDSDNVIAPFCIIEKCPENHFSSQGERAYDIDFTIDTNGKKINPYYPYHNTPKVDKKYQMSCVGTCMLTPAKLYHQGFKYNPKDPRGDHTQFCSSFADGGGKIFMTDETLIEHAYLPKWGERFH
tara:strand:- start:22299 stop:22961 length:663 start_codon:yes stop_codon:yes gene_type:complete